MQEDLAQMLSPTPPPDPNASVVPGVIWGRPEWVPSAAFWASMVALADEEADGFIERDVPLEEAVGFCLLGGYGITAELNQAAHPQLRIMQQS